MRQLPRARRPYDPATGQGTVGRNYAYQTMVAVNVFYPESIRINPFMGAGALGTVIDDYNGDNVDHSGLGFVGGGYISASTTGARPIEYHPVPPGTPRWGLAWKQAVRRHYDQTVSISVLGNPALLAVLTGLLALWREWSRPGPANGAR